MKREIILILILYLISGLTSIYAGESEYEFTRISMILEERRELTPDILNMMLSIHIISQKEAEAINILGSLDKAIRELNVKYTGGSYSVYKNCWWEKDRKRCAGYKGDINYSFELKEARDQNKIIETVEEFKEKYGEKLNYTISEPRWLISEKNVKKTENELKLEIIELAKDFSRKISEKLSKNCNISSIDYDIRRPFWEPIIHRSTVMEKAAIEAPEPKKEDKSIIIKASVRFLCR